jgi:hypothetical protein
MEIYIGNPLNGDKAKVDPQGRLLTAATSLTRYEQAARDGRAFNVNSGQFTINGGGEYGVTYIKNLNEKDLELQAWFFAVDNLTGTSTGQTLWKAYFNPTGGTLLTAGTEIIRVNRNGGASETFEDITALKASTATSTITGIDEPVLLQTQGSGRSFGNVFLTLPKNSSIAVSVDLKTSGDALVYQGWTGYFAEN